LTRAEKGDRASSEDVVIFQIESMNGTQYSIITRIAISSNVATRCDLLQCSLVDQQYAVISTTVNESINPRNVILSVVQVFQHDGNTVDKLPGHSNNDTAAQQQLQCNNVKTTKRSMIDGNEPLSVVGKRKRQASSEERGSEKREVNRRKPEA
jgi:hypothetical protein